MGLSTLVDVGTMVRVQELPDRGLADAEPNRGWLGPHETGGKRPDAPAHREGGGPRRVPRRPDVWQRVEGVIHPLDGLEHLRISLGKAP